MYIWEQWIACDTDQNHIATMDHRKWKTVCCRDLFWITCFCAGCVWSKSHHMSSAAPGGRSLQQKNARISCCNCWTQTRKEMETHHVSADVYVADSLLICFFTFFHCYFSYFFTAYIYIYIYVMYMYIYICNYIYMYIYMNSFFARWDSRWVLLGSPLRNGRPRLLSSKETAPRQTGCGQRWTKTHIWQKMLELYHISKIYIYDDDISKII